MNKIKLLLILVLFVLASFSLMGCSKDSKDQFIMNPDVEDIRDAITSIEHITTIEIVTEENDPNGNLGKQGGYTGALFFIYDLIDNPNNETPTEAGTSGGGSIEIYANVEDAEARNTYLGAFDGTIFASGSHVVLGTMVIRTSNDLTASEQQTLESAIIEAIQSR